MKTATIQQVPQQWSQILDWIAGDEEVQVTQNDRVVARIVPFSDTPATDFLARAKEVWGELPSGPPLGEMVQNSRGGDP